LSTTLIKLVDSNDFNTLIEELTGFQYPSPSAEKATEPELTEEDLKKYILKQSKALIDTGVMTAQDYASFALQNQNPDDVAALAEVMSATSKLIDTLNKSTLLDKKAEKDKELKVMELEAKKEIAQLKSKNYTTNNLNVLVASREEIMKKLFEGDKNIIEIENS
jgi:hypothetical protein